ncbi:3-hydroxyacyl-CoA dehydrogenase NAD-binding domain-containing protein [Nocardioides mangrovi]|uniref:3-hydroxyacyl-CoA dehydrogenase n=1 Tax=Nocardioides mangrovi TaxID=2874580 RepID=A0ABS7UEP6_9ACTN|nr:3-hydroxyacyl-CoA dehydrogenase NAD-binding domain-containing protein [Nocardioides mangrovi]MBZ5739474.1 3-hydroxyacyl-CoA dehydrogenase [Nocardioides mangrovi]
MTAVTAVTAVRSAPASVAVVGAGAIGGSWVALALAHGLRVTASDPAPGAEERLREAVRAHLAAIADDPDAALTRLDFEADPTDAAGDVDLVLEAGPERIDAKRELFAVLDAAAPADVLLASSSSGFGPSAFQDGCRHPERVVVTHPFNPPHLVPLVEVVGGRATSEQAVQAAMAAMRRLGRRPVRVRAELPGHVVNRLQAALWREAYDLVRRGAISVADLDAAVASGPGLRWALLGPIATQHLSGGPGGLDHVLEHLGPPMVDWWADLGDPELDADLVAALVGGVREELGGREAAVRAARDAALVELLATKERWGLDATARPDAGGER